MRVWIASLDSDKETLPVREFCDLAEMVSLPRHTLAASPTEADVVLFPDCHMFPHDPGLRALRRHPLWREFPDKCLVYDARDLPWLAWPGIYVSMPRHYLRHEFQEPWAYYRVPLPSGAMDTVEPSHPDLLFSFVGSCTHPVRRNILTVRHERAVIEEVRNFLFWDSSSPGFIEKRTRYYRILSRSKFVLCPRGYGTSSIRLYEVLAMGRVPVIIADDWAVPNGPDWSACSLRWPERGIDRLPDVLAAREDEYAMMATSARRVYEEWFSPARAFERIIDACERLLEREAPRRFRSGGVRSAYIRARLDRAYRRTHNRLGRNARRVAGW